MTNFQTRLNQIFGQRFRLIYLIASSCNCCDNTSVGNNSTYGFENGNNNILMDLSKFLSEVTSLCLV